MKLVWRFGFLAQFRVTFTSSNVGSKRFPLKSSSWYKDINIKIIHIISIRFIYDVRMIILI